MKFNWLNKGIPLAHHLQYDSQNNFTFIRLIAALIVVKQHSFSSTAENLDGSLMSTFKLSALGLPSFFFISGLLVSQSLQKSSSWKSFLWKRFLRIYPAAWLSILFCAFILGPIVTTCALKNYFSGSTFYKILSTCFLIRVHYYLPGVFEHSLMGNSSVNASLWTICLELKLYIGLLLFSLIKIPGKKYLLTAMIISMLIALQFFPVQSETFVQNLTNRHISMNTDLTYSFIFLTGVLANMYNRKIIVRNYWLILIFIMLIGMMNLGDFKLLVFIFVPVATLFAATKGVSFIKKITPKADLSYGIYVFAYPLQQVVANYLHPQGTWSFFLSAMIIIFPFAIFSWYIVEKKALGLKKIVR